MTLQDGDVVRFDYVLFVDDEKKPREASTVEAAKEHGIYAEDRRYEPLTVTVGGRQIIPGLEKALQEQGTPGAEFHVDIAPEEAYGPRDAGKMKDVPMVEFRKRKMNPEVGLILNYDGQRAIISRVAGGRVRLDLNHELAGKTLRYDVQVRDVITDDEEKLKALLDHMFPMGGYGLDIGDAVTFTVPDQAKFDREWPMHKFQVLTQIRQAVGVEKEIRLVESYPAQAPAPDVPGSDAEE